MIYVMSDLHGCYEEFLKALEVISFKDEDELYIIGDIMDRGKHPILLLQDLMMRPNVFPLMGNHDYMALTVLKKLCVEITDENVETHLKEEDLMNYYQWVKEGGHSTLREFQSLSYEEKMDIIEYLEEFSLCEEIRVQDKTYVLVHAGIERFKEEKSIYDFDFVDLIFVPCDYTRQYYQNKYLVTGHTPTFKIDESCRGKIYQKYNHIGLDCGCIYGLNLGVYCLNTQKCFYIEKQ